MGEGSGIWCGECCCGDIATTTFSSDILVQSFPVLCGPFETSCGEGCTDADLGTEDGYCWDRAEGGGEDAVFSVGLLEGADTKGERKFRSASTTIQVSCVHDWPTITLSLAFALSAYAP